MIETDDNLLVRKILAGQTHLFREIVEKRQKTVYNTAYRMTGSSLDAEDITQAVFLKIYENLGSYDEKYRFFSWMYRITVNETINFINKKRNFHELNDDLISTQRSPEQELESRETVQQVRSALMKLTLDQRSTIILRHYLDFSYAEMSYILKIPVKKVKSRLFTARNCLRKLLVTEGTIHDAS